MKKTYALKPRRNIFLLGVMILFSLFLIDFTSAASWDFELGGSTGWSNEGNISTDISGDIATINAEFWIINITKPTAETSDKAYILIKYANGTIASIANATFVGDTATFTTPVHIITGYGSVFFATWSGETQRVRAYKGASHPLGNTTWYSTRARAWSNDLTGSGFSEIQTTFQASIDSVGISNTEPVSENYILVDLTLPLDGSAISTAYQEFSSDLNITGSETDLEFANATINIWWNNGTVFNTTLVTGLSGNSTSIQRNISGFSYDSYLWNTYACYNNASFGNCSWSESNYTFSYVPFNNTGESYNLSTYETKNETFYLNISTVAGTTNMGAFLVYNGTSYAAEHSCSGTECQIWRKIDIPLVTTTGALNENKSFYWSITLFGTFGTSTTTTTPLNQNVTNILFSNSGCQPLYNSSINFTIYNETSKALINSDFKSTFNFWLGDGTVKDTYNFSGTGQNHYLFCVSHNQSYITNSEIELTSGVNARIYQFIKKIYNNTLQIQKLFIPDSAFISNIIIEVKNQGLVPEEDITVEISRYYTEYDNYEIVENKITDEFGQVIAKLVENNIIYKFKFYDSNGSLLKESDKVTVICRSSICVIPFIIETTDDYLDRYENLTLFDYELSFDNTTNIVTYAWDDQRGESTRYRLEVIRYKFNESTIVCNTTSTTSVSSLTCNVGDTPASYTIQIFRGVIGDEERRISYLQIIVGDYSSTFGVEGLFWVFILLMICVGIGVYDPKVGAVLYGVGFIFMGILKIIYMPVPVFFANTLLVILFVWAVKT